MKAMCLEEIGKPLQLREVEIPKPLSHQVLIRVHTCGVCRTDLHIMEGDLKPPFLPLILGHQIVGTIEALGSDVEHVEVNQRVGVPWLGSTCGVCPYCLAGQENLCDHPLFTGYTLNGGFAEYCVADARFIFPLPRGYDDLSLAPLLCAGLIGYRAFRLAGKGQVLGLYGFGSSAHLLQQVAKALGKTVFVFTRPNDEKTALFAKSLGADWVGGSDQKPPLPLDAALIFAPVGALMPKALESVKKGGKVISAGIHMSDIPSFPYSLLWEERSLSGVANLTREDGREFLALADKIPLQVHAVEYPLTSANEALLAIKNGSLEGSAVLRVSSHIL